MPVEYHLPALLSVVFSAIIACAVAALFLGKRYYRKQYLRRLSIREILTAAWRAVPPRASSKKF
jgi:hypothetical protein